MKRKWDVSDDETVRKCVDEVLTRLEQQGDAQFGVIAAEEIIDIVKQNLAPDIYNSALKDVQKVVDEKLADIQVDLDLLKQQR